MKIINLNNFVKLFNRKNGFDTIDEFFDSKNINEYDINDDVINQYCNTWKYDNVKFIEESLKSHDANSLIKKLKDIFKNEFYDVKLDNSINLIENDIVKIELNENNSFIHEQSVNNNTLNNNAITSKFYDIIQLWLFYVTCIEYENGHYCIYLEPMYTVSTKEKLKQNGYIGYHVTNIENTTKIKNSHGIRPKVGKIKCEGGYRYFPERIYFVGASRTKQLTKTNLNNLILSKNLINYAICVIDFSNFKNDFWEDRASQNIENAMYTYTFIPISKIINIVYDVNLI